MFKHLMCFLFGHKGQLLRRHMQAAAGQFFDGDQADFICVRCGVYRSYRLFQH